MGMFREALSDVKAKRKVFREILEEEKIKARKNADIVELNDMRTKARKKAEFGLLPPLQRAKERAGQGGTFLKKLGGAINKINMKLETAEKRFNQKGAEFSGQNTMLAARGNVQEQLGGSLGASILKKKSLKDEQNITINISK